VSTEPRMRGCPRAPRLDRSGEETAASPTRSGEEIERGVRIRAPFPKAALQSFDAGSANRAARFPSASVGAVLPVGKGRRNFV
jgi:hypothetical protein